MDCNYETSSIQSIKKTKNNKSNSTLQVFSFKKPFHSDETTTIFMPTVLKDQEEHWPSHHQYDLTSIRDKLLIFFSKKCLREMESVLNYIGEHVDKDKNRNQWMNRVLLKDEWVDGCGVSGCRLHSQFSKANVWIFMLTLVTRAIRCWWHD